MNVQELFLSTILDAVLIDSADTTRLPSIEKLLRTLEPSIPEDGTQYQIAYNVPGRERMRMKTGRFLTRKLSLNSGYLPDAAIQNIADTINTELFSCALEIKIVRGDAIVKNYADRVGGKSCMTGAGAGYTALYADNPEKCGQLVMTMNNDSARAIVWLTDSGETYMDCIYSTSQFLRTKMSDYASNRGWAHFKQPGHMTVSGLNYTDGGIPYMDTFIYGEIVADTLTVSNYCGRLSLQAQDGLLESGRPCENCGDRVEEDNTCWSEDGQVYCLDCYHELFTQCNDCGYVYAAEDCFYLESEHWYLCEDCCARRLVNCAVCDRPLAGGAGTWRTTGGTDVYCGDCFHNAHTICDNCDEYFKNDEIVDGKCQDCGGLFASKVVAEVQ